MDQTHMASMALYGIGSLIIAIFIYPLILSAANRCINGFWSPYWRSVGTVVLTLVIVGIIGFIIGKVVGLHHFWAGLVITLVLQTLIGGALMNAFIKRADSSPLGFGRAALAFLVLAIIIALVGIASRPFVATMQANAKKMQAQAQQMQQQDSAAAPAATVSTPAATAPAMTASAPAAATTSAMAPAAEPASVATAPAAAASSH